MPSIGEPFIPEHLRDDAQACIEVLKASVPAEVYSRSDSYLLAAFGMAWALHKEAAHRLSDPTFEAVTTGPNGEMALNLWLKVLNDQAKMMAQLGDRLALSPKARLAIQLPDRKVPRSKFDGLLELRGSSPSLNA